MGMKVIDHWLYWRWIGMKKRCYQPSRKEFKNYGGRGIGVCSEWRKNFWNYVAYVESLPGYQDGFTIDRINNEGDYEPGNIRWASRASQNSNKRKKKPGSKPVRSVGIKLEDLAEHIENFKVFVTELNEEELNTLMWRMRTIEREEMGCSRTTSHKRLKRLQEKYKRQFVLLTEEPNA